MRAVVRQWLPGATLRYCQLVSESVVLVLALGSPPSLLLKEHLKLPCSKCPFPKRKVKISELALSVPASRVIPVGQLPLVSQSRRTS